MKIAKGISYVDTYVISDKDIINSIGVITYSKLQYKFPDVFQYFRECKLNCSDIGVIPHEHNLYLEYEAFDLKREIILCMLYNDYESSVRFLLNSTPPPKNPLMQYEDFSFIWIIICFVNILLLVLCTYLVCEKNKDSFLRKKYL